MKSCFLLVEKQTSVQKDIDIVYYLLFSRFTLDCVALRCPVSPKLLASKVDVTFKLRFANPFETMFNNSKAHSTFQNSFK